MTAKPPRPIRRQPDPARRPAQLDPNAGAELDPTLEWLAHLAGGRTEVKR